ncbi:pilus assembly protein PilN [Moritella marina ATCC 15381]|uniref:Pilus assembly protein PilN n=1 Tax=Moritella marina ATCC 15381 TaxID=1202962 RepID=A0A5J6WRH3_MORMI|nr:PilN domain-containing protein [Moritella marina]QFI39838.1 pilus assembly protein PilN [Moritella marina ATCC 15381]
MSNINLLPWREAQKKQRQQRFYSLTGISLGTTLLVMIILNMVIGGFIDNQKQRNALLMQEMQVIDVKLGKIKELRGRKDKLQERIDLIQSLQRSRNTPTQLMNTLPQLVPAGVNLAKLTFKNDIIKINGSSDSNTRLAVLLRNIEESSWLRDGNLDSIVALSEGEGNRFEMRFSVTPMLKDEGH